MKKIIELAERVCNPRTPFIISDLYELDRAIGERKELEQTLITEEWLKEHGFEKYPSTNIYELATEDYTIHCTCECDTLTVYKHIDWDEDICYELPNPRNVAQLQDACELCGIEI